jgi:hypothetical protein
MVNRILTSEWAYHRNTLLALRRLCCIDLRLVQEDVAERAMNGRPGRRIGAEVLRLALAKVVAPLEALRVDVAPHRYERLSISSTESAAGAGHQGPIRKLHDRE